MTAFIEFLWMPEKWSAYINKKFDSLYVGVKYSFKM